MSVNKYALAGRYDSLPVDECRRIAYTLEGLIQTERDKNYVADAKLRLAAIRQRIAA